MVFRKKIKEAKVDYGEEVSYLRRKLKQAQTYREKMSFAGSIGQAKRWLRQQCVLYQTYIDLHELDDDCISHYTVAKYQRRKFGSSISKKLNIEHFGVSGRPADFRVKPWPENLMPPEPRKPSI